MNNKKYLTKLFELAQLLSTEAFLSEDQETAAIFYDASHLCDAAALRLKQLEEEK